MTEEDLKTKVIYTWLKDIGFKDNQLFFEYSFKINLGKYTYKVKPSEEIQHHLALPRSDILVKDTDGNNLLIIEVKEPTHVLSESDKLQAISYARLLPQIAPFAILTNGSETEIYDSITCELLIDPFIPHSHQYVQNNFKVTIPDYTFYNRALELFIGLSKDNLLAFCTIQVNESMRLLKSEDIFSGKKYIPSLFIRRHKQEKKLEACISEQENNLILLTGSPQHGKTSFICNFIDSLIAKGYPCIFYPAINIQNSLLDELESDFKWMISEQAPIRNIFAHKLQDILEKSHSNIFLFIDGLNETSLEFISTLNKDFSRLKNFRITFILSFTNTTAKRLLIDSVNNITEIANHLSLSMRDIEALEIGPTQISKNVITIPPYSDEEATKALKKYSKLYNVTVKTKDLFHDPFLLRIIMNYYQGKIFDGNVDEIKLLEYYIQEKIHRTKELDELTIENILERISSDIFLNDSPLPLKNILQYTTSKDIEHLYESALLSRTYKGNKKYLEFYNEREQCYFISLIAREWDIKLKTYDSFLLEVKDILKTNAGSLALSWYFKINPFIIQGYWKSLFSEDLHSVHAIFLKSLRQFLHYKNIQTEMWISNFVEKGLTSKDEIIKVESLKLIRYFPTLKDKFLDVNYEIFIENILFNTKDELEYDPFDLINYDTLKDIHTESYLSIYDDSEITSNLKRIILEKQNQKALEALAYCSPFICIMFLDKEVRSLKGLVNNTLSLVQYMKQELEYFYNDYMDCPSFFSTADQEKFLNEYKTNFYYYNRFLKIYSNNIPLLNHFQSLLENIKRNLDESSLANLIEEGYMSIEGNSLTDHPKQIYFDFA